MSRIYKAPNVQLGKEGFRIDYTPALNLNQNIENFEEIDDDMNFGIPNFEDELKISGNREKEIALEIDAKVDDILEEAKIKAQDIIEQAKVEADKIKGDIYEDARSEGYNEGFTKGKSEATAEMDTIIQKKLEELEEQKAEIEKVQEQNIVDLEYQAVEVIGDVLDNLLNNAFKFENTLIKELVKIGLQQTSILENVNVKVASNCFDAVNSSIDDLYKFVDSNVTINLVSDKALEDNECIIETENGFIKCDLNSVIDSLKFNLKSIFGSKK